MMISIEPRVLVPDFVSQPKLALFPGPAQLSVAFVFSLVRRESGNKAKPKSRDKMRNGKRGIQAR